MTLFPTIAEQFDTACSLWPDAFHLAVLDAALIPNLPDTLEAWQVEHQLLLSGTAADEMRDIGPYIVHMPRGSRIAQAVFDHGPAAWQLWGRRFGMVLVTDKDLAATRAHLRHYLRLRDGAGKWYHLRFWDPTSIAALLDATLPEERAAFISGCGLRAVVFEDLLKVPLAADEVPPLALRLLDPAPNNGIRRISLQQGLLDAFADLRLKHWTAENARRLWQEQPEWCTRHAGNLGEVVAAILARARAWGLRERGSQRLFLDIEVALGPGFDTNPACRWATNILGAPQYSSEGRRAEALHDALRAHAPDLVDGEMAWA